MAQPDSQPLAILKGIYSLKGDVWRLSSVAPVGKERPITFPAEPSLGEVLVLKRQKP